MRVSKSFSLSMGATNLLEREAKQTGVSASALVDELIRRYLGRLSDEKQQKNAGLGPSFREKGPR